MPGALRSYLYGELRGVGDVDLWVQLSEWSGAGDFLGGGGGEYGFGIYGTGELPAAVEY